MRSHMPVDWAFGLVGAIENIVRASFPADLRRWPLLLAFNFEAYHIAEQYLVLVMRDKVSGIPAGPSVPIAFPFADHPPVPPTAENVGVWQAYLRERFGLRPDDAAIIVPIHDSGRNAAAADYDLFSPAEQRMWTEQLQGIVARQRAHLERAASVAPSPPPSLVYNVSGSNARVVINSTDASVNVAGNAGDIFAGLRNAVDQRVSDANARSRLHRAVDELESSYGRPGFLPNYKDFMALAADHITVFGPLLGLLAGLLS